MTPGLPFTDTSLQYSLWKRQLQGNESMAVQNINPEHIAAFRSPTGVATRDTQACHACTQINHASQKYPDPPRAVPRPSHIDSI